MDEDRIATAKKILNDVIYITLATVSDDGVPWNSPVYAAFDEHYTFYWTSLPTAQHSRNIAANGRAFVVVYDSNAQEGTGDGVYMRGRAAEVTDPKEMEHALRLYYERKHKDVKSANNFIGNAPRRLYAFRPEKFWMNEFAQAHGHGVDRRVEISL